MIQAICSICLGPFSTDEDIKTGVCAECRGSTERMLFAYVRERRARVQDRNRATALTKVLREGLELIEARPFALPGFAVDVARKVLNEHVKAETIYVAVDENHEVFAGLARHDDVPVGPHGDRPNSRGNSSTQGSSENAPEHEPE